MGLAITHRPKAFKTTIALLIGLLLVMPTSWVLASDDDLEPDSEIAEEIEDALDVEDELDDELEDDLEDALEDQLEAMIENGTITEDMEDALEERLEAMLENGELTTDDLENNLSSLIEDQLRTLPGQYEDLFQHHSQLDDIEKAVMDFEVFAMEDEYIALLDEASLETAKANGAVVASVEKLDELGQLLVTFSKKPPEQAQTHIQAQANHLYTLDADPIAEASQTPLQPMTLQEATNSVYRESNPSLAIAGQPMIIGMMDSKIQESHACFQHTDITQHSFKPSAAQADYHHGTAMASAINQCGRLNGVAIFNAEVFGRTPKGLVIASAADLIKGLNWLLKQNVNAVSLSLSGPPNQILSQVLNVIMSRGILVTASVGNEGAAAFPRFPAAQPGVLAITAVDRDLQIYPKAVRGDHVDFAVPGVSVLLAAPSGQDQPKSGTSVANALATPLLLQAHLNGLTLEVLRAQSQDLGEPGRDAIYGYGLLHINLNNHGIKSQTPR